MSEIKSVFLKKGRDVSLKRKHPWVFSGGVKNVEKGIENGDVVKVRNHADQIVGVGHYHEGSIAVRVLSFEDANIDHGFWRQKVQDAYELRKTIGLVESLDTTCYRLINAEGDQLSGLIVDIYNSTAVIQCHSLGMYNHMSEISRAITEVYGSKIDTVYDKNRLDLSQRLLLGMKEHDIVLENGLSFKVNWSEGQKTGFFIDQRENRNLLGQYAGGKSVLNTFCYTGGFSVYAQMNGAKKVDSVDISKTAIALASENMNLNAPQHHVERAEVAEDVMKFLRESYTEYDIIVVDPPAFAKSQRKRHNAVQAYKRLNALALNKVKPGGLIFTFSCSQVVDRALFNDTMRSAAIESGRSIQILHYLSQPADHTSNIYHPEGAYLKGLVLKVN